MCGIAGKYSLREAPADRAPLSRMAELMYHRGPNAGGESRVSLGPFPPGRG